MSEFIHDDPYARHPKIYSAWIYIAIDARDMNMCKVGVTTKVSAAERIISSTANPFYILFNSYDMAGIGISQKELYDFEKYLHRKIASRVPMIQTGQDSEWIETSPIDAALHVEFRIARGFENRSFINEDGEVMYQAVQRYRTEHRPNPRDIADRVGRRGSDYVNYLIEWHNANTLGYDVPRRY